MQKILTVRKLKQTIFEYKNRNKKNSLAGLTNMENQETICPCSIREWRGAKNHIVTLQKMFYGIFPVGIKRLTFE